MAERVMCFGELIIDMVQPDGAKKIYEAHPGGAPANVAVGIMKLGGTSAFIGKVGSDSLGQFLVETLKTNNVNVDGLKQGGQTAMALVSLAENGERSFEFYGDLVTYSESDIDSGVLDGNSVFHYGSISLIGETEKRATLKCIELAKANGATISYDPNLRLLLWGRKEPARAEELAKEGIRLGMKYAEVLKIADNELEFLTGETDIESGIKKLLEINPGLKLIAVTLGADGSYCWYQGQGKAIPTIKVDAVDTTGAGDGFMAGLLYSIQANGGLENMDQAKIEQAFKLGNTVGSIATTKKGAIPALPTMEEVQKYL